MKIHRVVQMLGATTSTGKLADDMYDLGHKDYYSKEQDKYIPISHMDFQHVVRAFVKQNDEAERCMKERNFLQEENENLEKQLGSSHRAYKMGFERNGRHIEEVKRLELENQRLVQQLEHDETVVSKEAYQVMWDNCEKLKKDLKKTDDIVENNDKIYKKNLQKQEDNLLYLTSKIENMKAIIEEKEELIDKWSEAEHRWRKAYQDVAHTNGHYYTFSEVPQDAEGREFVKNCKKYLNKESYNIRVKGQHLKKELYGKGRAYHGANMEDSTHMRVYIDTKRGD